MLAKAKYRKDYKQPGIARIRWNRQSKLHPKHTVVTAKTTFQRLNDEATHLRLDGHGFQFASIKFNGEDFKHYHQDHESLTLDLTNQSAVNFDRTFISQNSQFFAIIPHNFHYKIEKNYVRNTGYRKCLWCIKY